MVQNTISTYLYIGPGSVVCDANYSVVQTILKSDSVHLQLSDAVASQANNPAYCLITYSSAHHRRTWYVGHKVNVKHFNNCIIYVSANTHTHLHMIKYVHGSAMHLPLEWSRTQLAFHNSR